MADRSIPTQAEFDRWVYEEHTWGRWGKDDDSGAVNLITDAKRLAATRLVKRGRSISLSRVLPTDPAPGNVRPVHYWMHTTQHPGGVAYAADYVGTEFHGVATTHLDALCHYWGEKGMWNGRDPKEVIKFDGATFGTVERWVDGIITRGVLLDVPRHRKQPYVKVGEPVHDWELEEIMHAQGVTLEPGDALVVYSGRERYEQDFPQADYTSNARPGLHATCMRFIKKHDIAVLVWDAMDARPTGYKTLSTIHCAIFAYGIALLDNAYLATLAQACAEEKRYEFMLTIAPLRVKGGTGSPANPIALL
ncbi:MAG: cyclase family protein [Dehalococcoidia bacterium]|nr:cyclase family protein [Dehalococcoidia bacterium]